MTADRKMEVLFLAILSVLLHSQLGLRDSWLSTLQWHLEEHYQMLNFSKLWNQRTKQDKSGSCRINILFRAIM